MKNLVRKLPFAVEFGVVLLFAFGPFVFSAWRMMPRGQRAQVRFSDTQLLYTIAIEAVLALLLLGFLHLRGYTRADFPFRFAPREWAIGALLLVASYAAVILATVLGAVWLGSDVFMARQMKVDVAVTLPIAIIGSLVNAFYEEIFVVGYLLRALEKSQGIAAATVFSVFVRFAYHIYQGPTAIFVVIPLGFVFAAFFVRTRNLWPLVLAHAVIDIIAFSVVPR
ncbi:MAG TPA: CPBP family intramembrane glutamic endopeptidase [Abditibacteriaceae bacterium]|jgi:membrane protease YdiL (CAAX protease family)